MSNINCLLSPNSYPNFSIGNTIKMDRLKNKETKGTRRNLAAMEAWTSQRIYEKIQAHDFNTRSWDRGMNEVLTSAMSTVVFEIETSLQIQVLNKKVENFGILKTYEIYSNTLHFSNFAESSGVERHVLVLRRAMFSLSQTSTIEMYIWIPLSWAHEEVLFAYMLHLVG